ncbi:YihY/virulence factor BrkB family protein [Agromyces sp. NBRC 114283]|uniref:YihY/virulence factor BrkB family protein n=1 Tax=Agromyces sp. NBRC 114283 TaxID=2994521 RepID=UPI0024A29B8A|nr:YihY/virulence factor BrkB family protein [Agromyces sp. NBRC 114283]GLU89636.1 membrane protein [Agromyces sp. NBRC 114283]
MSAAERETTPATTTPSKAGWLKRLVAWVLERKPVRAFLLYQEHHGPMLADSVTYRALFSVFAGVLLGFSVAGIWLSRDDEAMQALVDAVGRTIPGLVGEGGAIDPSSLVQPVAFSVAGIVGLVGLVGTAIGAVGSLAIAFRELADQAPDQTFVVWAVLRNLAIAVGFGVALGAGAVVTMAGTAAIGSVLDWLGVPSRSGLADFGVQALSILVVLAIDTVAVAALFRLLSGLRPRRRSLWTGALLGGVGLTVLQVLSGLFIGGASSNPLLASFASIIALLLWLNLSSQVVLIAGAYIVTGVDEEHDRVAARYGSPTIAVRRLQRAERRAMAAVAEVQSAREAVEKERG